MPKSQARIHRGYLEALARREYHLRQRIAQSGRIALSYDKHEAAALHWAIEVLADLLDVEEARIERDATAVR